MKVANEVLKTIAENKIKELEKEVLGLKGELKSHESFHLAAWREYGSELCVGSFIVREDEIRRDIAEVERKISLLKRLIEGKLDISREKQLRKSCSEIAIYIKSYQDSSRIFEAELSEIAELKNLLKISSLDNPRP